MMEFDEALALVRDGAPRPGGIGTLGEKTMHATLKLWLDGDATHHEVALPNGTVADIFDGDAVTEVQTANFSGFRKKLARLLEDHPVTVVHPVVRRKYLVWIDPATGEASAPRRSPRVGGYTDAGTQLIYLLPLLGHPRLTVRLVLLDVEEQRLADGRGRDGKRGSHRAERIPLAMVGEVTLTRAEDYAALLPEGLPDPFTAAQCGRAAHLQGRRLSGVLKVLTDRGILERRPADSGKGYLYYRKGMGI